MGARQRRLDLGFLGSLYWPGFGISGGPLGACNHVMMTGSFRQASQGGYSMRTRSRAALLSAAVALAGMSASACGYISVLKAQMAFKDANHGVPDSGLQEGHRKVQGGARAQARPVDGLLLPRKQLRQPVQARPQGRGGKRRQPAGSHQLLQKATETITDNPKLRKLSYQYLLAAYGSEKLDDPSQAEPIVKKMIEMEPDEPNNYYALAKIYENAGNYEEAEKMLIAARDRRPKDATDLHAAGRRSTTARAGSTRPSSRSKRARRPSRTTPRRTTRLPRTSGTRPSATSA